MAKPLKLAHVVYMTRRFDEMVAWYETVFEARVQYQNPVLAFLTFDDEHHRFAFANMSVLRPDIVETDTLSKLGVNHVGYTFANIGDLLETYAQVTEARPGWDAVLRQYDVRFVLVPPDNALASVLQLSPGWKRIYSDWVAAVYERVG